jgi:16S rRNA (uracil1498-N3)-methyltransferase
MTCERSIVRYDVKKAQARVERWQTIAREAAKQAKRDIVPAIRPILEFKDVVSNCPADFVAIMLYEGITQNSLRDVLRRDHAGCYILLIGPEGGFSQEETMLCSQLGVYSVTLGPRILRTETASLAAVSIIQYECGDLGGVQCRE